MQKQTLDDQNKMWLDNWNKQSIRRHESIRRLEVKKSVTWNKTEKYKTSKRTKHQTK